MLTRFAPRRDDRGFTLTELLVAIVLLGIIVGPLASGLITFMRNIDKTTGRLSESHDLQIAAAYFAQDVESLGVRKWTDTTFPLLQSVETNAPASGGVSGRACGGAGTPNAVVRLAWDDPTSASVTPPPIVRAAYIVTTVGTEKQLRRIVCVGASTTPVSNIVLVHNLVDAGPADCTPVACANYPDIPQKITLRLVIKNEASTATYEHILIGQRRQT
ncbi:hypothetical protein GCM10009682_60320 [Luedemannella flava]|uniref:Prepilin-type N-terminal cleavage/methylation domain-containing protein n=1 Tax=Luedemannella flava TaxID=349316 RepID=A0ABN2MP25_9ACTN